MIFINITKKSCYKGNLLLVSPEYPVGRYISEQEMVPALKEEDKSNKDMIKAINKTLNRSYQKTAVVRYDAFAGMGGLSSFAMTLLDRNDSGILLNCIHSRESCYTYIKEITQGECDKALSKEEARSLEEAKNKH